MTQPQDREAIAAEAEEQRQRDQAAAERDRQQAEKEGAAFRERQAADEAAIDPASAAGQQAAMRRGDPVQLQGDDALRGTREGVRTTHNESAASYGTEPGPQGTSFRTGADGEPVPVEHGYVQEVPGHVTETGGEPYVNEAQTAGTPQEHTARAAQAADAAEQQDYADDDMSAEATQWRSRRAQAQQAQGSAGADGPGVSQ